MTLPHDAIEHPDALAEGLAIAKSGSLPHIYALGELSGVLDSLFDGPSNPAYVGASKRAENVAYEYPAHGTVRVFLRWFWREGAGVVAVICVAGDRPILMSVVAIGVSKTAELDESEAESLALNNAIARLNDL